MSFNVFNLLLGKVVVLSQVTPQTSQGSHIVRLAKSTREGLHPYPRPVMKGMYLYPPFDAECFLAFGTLVGCWLTGPGLWFQVVFKPSHGFFLSLNHGLNHIQGPFLVPFSFNFVHEHQTVGLEMIPQLCGTREASPGATFLADVDTDMSVVSMGLQLS